jgi:hypothetical protein
MRNPECHNIQETGIDRKPPYVCSKEYNGVYQIMVNSIFTEA